MDDNYDLYKLETDSTLFCGYKSGTHSIIDDKDTHEVIFQDENGRVDGEFLMFNSQGEVLSECSDSISKNIENLSKVVGRVFCGYSNSNEPDKYIWYCGTGFRVNPDKIITAANVVKDKRFYNGLEYTFKKVYIFFGVDASEKTGINLKTFKGAYELELLPRFDLDKKFPLNPVIGNFTWQTLNDLAQLKFKRQPPFDEYVLPISPSQTTASTDQITVLGYPGSISRDKFAIDYSNGADTDLYDQIIKTINFESKTASIGHIIKASGAICSHRCPTLRGTSGGLCADLNEDSLHFIGIHVGGSSEMKNNYFIPVTSESFLYFYFKHVIDSSFKEENIKVLQPLLELYNHLNNIH